MVPLPDLTIELKQECQGQGISEGHKATHELSDVETHCVADIPQCVFHAGIISIFSFKTSLKLFLV